MPKFKKKEKEKHLAYIHLGREFYHRSGSQIGQLYRINGAHYVRSDWGRIQVLLREGTIVTIKPATEEQLKYFENLLKTL